MTHYRTSHVKRDLLSHLLKQMPFILILLILVARPAKSQVSWRQIWGPVGMVAVGYDMIEQMTVVYATTRGAEGKVYAYYGTPNSWQCIGDYYQQNPNGPPIEPVRMLAVGGSLGELFGLYGIQVFRYTGKEKSWEWLGGPYDALYGGPGMLCAISTGDKNVFDYDKQRGVSRGLPWALRGGPAQQLAIGGPDRLYRLPPDESGVWQFDKTVWGWKQIGGPAKAIYAGGTELFAVSPATGDIYRYNGAPNSWTRIGGPGKMFAVDYNGRLYGLSPDGGAVFMYTGTPMKWNKIGGAAESIYAGGYESRVYATNPTTHDLWELKLQQ